MCFSHPDHQMPLQLGKCGVGLRPQRIDPIVTFNFNPGKAAVLFSEHSVQRIAPRSRFIKNLIRKQKNPPGRRRL